MSEIVSVGTILFSSDARIKYAEDILTVIASPSGAIVRFRYEQKYVDGDLQNAVGSQAVIGREVMIAFLEGDPSAGVMLPIRAANISAAKRVPGAYVFDLQVSWFPDLSAWVPESNALAVRGGSELASVRAASGGGFAASSRSGLQYSRADDQEAAWNELVRRLGLFSRFSKSYFLRTELVSRPNVRHTLRHKIPKRQSLKLNARGELIIFANAGFTLNCWFYGANYDPDQGTISVTVDESVLKVASDSSYSIRSRYDEVDFWFRSQELKADAATYVNLSLPGGQSGASLSTFMRFPIIVKRSRSSPVVAGSISGIGAALIASPAILGAGTDIVVRLVLAATGALAISTFAAWTARR